MSTTQGFQMITDTEPIQIRAWGKTMHELFCNSLRGMAALMKPTIFATRDNARKVTQLLRVEAVDTNTLLVSFLSEVIRLSEIHNLIFTHAIFKHLGENFLEAEISGVPIDDRDNEVRAVAYQDVDITRNKDTGLHEAILEFEL